MNKVRSEYLQREFEVSVVEMESEGRMIEVISHDAIEDIIHNQISLEANIIYDYNIVASDETHSVVICTMCDQNQRRVQSIGESLSATLTSDIAKQYPTLIAAQRAFDRAAIRFLALPGKVFSDLELESSTEKIIGDNAFTETVVTMGEESNSYSEEIPSEQNTETEPGFVTSGIKTSGGEGSIESSLDRMAELGQTVITIGKYNGKNKTINEIYENDLSWFEFIVGKDVESFAAERRHEAENMKAYKELRTK